MSFSISRLPKRTQLGICVAAVATTFLVFHDPVLNTASHWQRNEYTATVTDKRAETDKRGNERLFVITRLSDGRVREFLNANSFLESKFDKEAMQESLRVGETYHLDTYGRNIPAGVPLIPRYENIVGFERLSDYKSRASAGDSLRGD